MVGLVNKNPILAEGSIVQNSGGKVERFASTSGCTLSNKPITELYASNDLISLTVEQQARVEEVAAGIYHPCCNNPTLFPDCNHGMAMLGILELMDPGELLQMKCLKQRNISMPTGSHNKHWKRLLT